MTGWIKLHKKIATWEWYTDSQTVHLFVHLLFKANYKPSKWRGLDVGVGQLVTGRKQLSKETGISERSIRTILNRLKSTNELTIKSTNRFSIITILNYSKYQSGREDTDQQNDQPSANKRPATDHIQEYKEGKKKDNIICPQQAGGPPPCPHEEIISLYHEILPELRMVRSWNDTRRKYLRSRWREDESRQSLDWWERYFRYVKKSSFLCGLVEGNNGRTFSCDLEWLIRPTNFVKVIEGKYHNERSVE